VAVGTKIIKSPYFWISVVLFLLLAVIADLFLLYIWTLPKLINGQWNLYLLEAGLFSALLMALPKKKKTELGKKLLALGRIILFVSFIWAFKEYGFFKDLTFLAMIIFVSRLASIILGKLNLKL
jgi:hypothetical protein